MSNRSGLVFAGLLCALVSGCGGGNGGTTDYRDFLVASGIVYQADGKTVAASLPVSNYAWVTTFTDGSTVANDITTDAPIVTDTAGKFALASSQLALQSGNQVQSCTEVCVDWATGSEDVCTDWQTASEEVCTDWQVDADGTEYCANWETNTYDYCANWVTQTYDYCDAYAQDCGWVYPSRAISDIVSSYSEITYNDGTKNVTTQSQETTLAAAGVQPSTSTVSGSDTIVSTQWAEHDTFITTLVAAAAVKTASTMATATGTQVHAPVVRKPKIMKRSGTPHFGRTHKPAAVVSSDKLHTLTSGQQLKLDSARNGCGAYPKTSDSLK